MERLEFVVRRFGGVREVFRVRCWWFFKVGGCVGSRVGMFLCLREGGFGSRRVGCWFLFLFGCRCIVLFVV